jgi:hypothetical protein
MEPHVRGVHSMRTEWKKDAKPTAVALYHDSAMTEWKVSSFATMKWRPAASELTIDSDND